MVPGSFRVCAAARRSARGGMRRDGVEPDLVDPADAYRSPIAETGSRAGARSVCESRASAGCGGTSRRTNDARIVTRWCHATNTAGIGIARRADNAPASCGPDSTSAGRALAASATDADRAGPAINCRSCGIRSIPPDARAGREGASALASCRADATRRGIGVAGASSASSAGSNAIAHDTRSDDARSSRVFQSLPSERSGTAGGAPSRRDGASTS